MATEPSSTVLDALRVLELFKDHRQLGVTQCATLLGLTRGKAHRLLVTLAAAGAVDRVGSGQYRLSTWAFEIGAQAPLLRALTGQVQVPMERLVADTRLEAHLAVREGTELLYLVKLSHAAGRVQTRTGGRNPLYATGLGKVLLAYAPESVLADVLAAGLRRHTKNTVTSATLLREELAEIRRTGFSYDHEELQVGVACIATALHDREGGVVAALSIPTNAEQYGYRLPSLRRPLQVAARSMEEILHRLPTSVFTLNQAKPDDLEDATPS